MPDNSVLLTPAAARQVLIGPDGRFTADGVRLLNALIAVAQQAAQAATDSSGALQADNNLSDVQSVVTSRANLGLGSAAVHPASDFDAAGAAAAAQAASLQISKNLSDLNSAATARTNLGLAAVASTGSYNDLANQPTLPANAPTGTHQFLTGYNSTTGTFSQAQPGASDISGLAAVATSGSYTDLSNKPTLPSNAPAGTHQFLSAYNAATGAFTQAQPAASDISGLAASATTDTTNAGNISAGTLADARLSSNVPLKNAANSFSAAQTVSVSSTNPGASVALWAPNLSTSSAASVSYAIGSANGSGTSGFLVWYSGSGSPYLSLETWGGARPVTLNPSGRTLVGTTTDNGTDRLQVNGTVNATSLKITQNSTGSGSAALGANCPAVTAAAPYTWIKVTAADGSTVYVPAWK